MDPEPSVKAWRMCEVMNRDLCNFRSQTIGLGKSIWNEVAQRRGDHYANDESSNVHTRKLIFINYIA